VLTPPGRLTSDKLAQVLSDGWGLTAASIDYRAVGRPSGRSCGRSDRQKSALVDVRAWNIASLRVLEKNRFVRDHGRWDENGELIYLRYELQGQ
jgi:hypothetical protein